MRDFSKTMRVGAIYLFIIFLTLIVRIGFAVAPPPDEAIDAVFTTVVQVLLFGIVPMTLYCVFVLKKDSPKNKIKNLFSDFGFKRRLSLKTVLITIAVATLMIFSSYFISLMWNLILALLGYTHIPSETVYDSVGVLITELILTAVLPAFFEEVTHRGLLFAGYKDTNESPVFIILMTALLFSLMHQNIAQTGYTFYAGIIMGYLCFYSRSIWPPIIAHFMNNAWSVISDYVEQNGGYVLIYVNKFYDFLTGTVWGLLLFLTLFVVSVILIVLLFKALKNEYHKDFFAPSREKPAEAAEASKELNPSAESIDSYYEQKITAPLGTLRHFEKDAILRQRRKDNIYIYITIAIGAVATVFSMIWGFLR